MRNNFNNLKSHLLFIVYYNSLCAPAFSKKTVEVRFQNKLIPYLSFEHKLIYLHFLVLVKSVNPLPKPHVYQ